MSSHPSKEYKMFVNYMRNELGITKEMIRDWTKEAIYETIKKRIEHEFNSKRTLEWIIIDTIREHRNLFWSSSDDSFDEYIKKQVVSELLHGVKLKVEIAKTKKESTPLTNVRVHGNGKDTLADKIKKTRNPKK